MMRVFQVPALGFRDFRFLCLAMAFSSVGLLGEQVTLGWLVLELTDSPFMVGLALSLRMAPLSLVGIPAGVLVDRVDRRRLIGLVAVAMAAEAVGLGLLILTGVVQVWQVLLLTLLGGCLQAVYQTARQSYTHDIVGTANVLNGLALVTLAMRLGGLAGSLLAGSLIARLGTDAAYFALAGGYLLTAVALVPARARPHEVQASRESLRRTLIDYFGMVRLNRVLALLIAFTAAAEMLGFSHQVLLPSLARDVLHVGPEGLGVMNGVRSIGGMFAVVLLSALGQVRRNGLLYLAVLLVFGGSLVGLGFAPSYLWALLLLVLANGTAALTDILSQSLMQMSVPDAFRGRAGGSWVVAIGTGPVGRLQIGAMASLLGTTVALAASGLGLIAVAVGGVLLVPRLRRL